MKEFSMLLMDGSDVCFYCGEYGGCTGECEFEDDDFDDDDDDDLSFYDDDWHTRTED